MVVSHLLCSEAEASSSSESQSGTHNSFPQVCLERMQNESRENANIRTFVDSLSSPRDAREGTSFHMFRLHHHQIESISPRYPSGRRVFGQDSILAANKLFHGVQVFKRTSNSVLFMITGRFSCCTCLGHKARFSNIGQIWRGAGMMVRDGTTSKLANNTLSSEPFQPHDCPFRRSLEVSQSSCHG